VIRAELNGALPLPLDAALATLREIIGLGVVTRDH
jgi:hypothetical protein